MKDGDGGRNVLFLADATEIHIPNIMKPSF